MKMRDMATKENQLLEIIENTIKRINKNIENNLFDEATIQVRWQFIAARRVC